MHYSLIVWVLTVLAETTLVSAQPSNNTSEQCKCVPGEPCWPSSSEIDTLNQTVAGKLVRGVPPGSVCYSDQSGYNETRCQHVRDNWFVSTFHALDPISVGFPQWAGNPCPPIFPNGTSVTGDSEAGAKGCHVGGYPAYALNATDARHVQSVVQFAKGHNIRLNAKSTGHSFTGRSTAFGSISIWTHYLQGIQYHENFQAESCSKNGTQVALRISAGSRIRDVYEAADAHGVIVVGGSAQDVGIVGWSTGGGHGPLSETYGMGADNMLQVTVVTPEGELVTANDCLHPDLFWAVRGGGGGTFGVITEVVMKAHQSSPMQTINFDLSPIEANNLSPFWDAVTYFWSELPRLKEGRLSGYAFIFPPQSSLDGMWRLFGSFSVFDKLNGTAESLFDPIHQHFAPQFDSVNWTTSSRYSPSFFQSWNSTIGYEPVGGAGAVLGSRLLPARSLIADRAHVGATLQNLTAVPTTLGLPIQFFMVGNSDNRHLNISLNPAWRDATIHVITADAFAENSTPDEKKAAYEQMSYTTTPQLKSLAPDSGAYINEGDPHDPDWQWTYFGENYARLKSVKEKYDPDSVMWCRSCVGSETWVPQDKYGIHDGEGRLCRASWALRTQEKR